MVQHTILSIACDDGVESGSSDSSEWEERVVAYESSAIPDDEGSDLLFKSIFNNSIE